VPNNSTVLPLGVAEGEKAEILLSPTRLHHLVQAVFPVRIALLVLCIRRAEDALQLTRSLAGLAGMGFIHDHRVFARCDRRLPRFRLLFLLLGHLFLALRARGVQ
jgi:hypothetical protein